MALIYCSKCGKQVSDKATTCPHCNAPLQGVQPQPAQPQMGQPFQTTNATQQAVYVNMGEGAKKSNSLGTAGLVLAIIAFFFCWVPGLGWILWFLGMLFSFIGVFKTPRGCAIAGLIISFIGLIILISVVGAIAAAFSL